MKSVIAALLLLFQFQPVLGTAACLGLIGQPGQEDCTMPEHGQAPANIGSDEIPLSSSTCAMAQICAPTQPAVPAASGRLARALPPNPAPPAARSQSLPDVTTTPPLPPPRV